MVWYDNMVIHLGGGSEVQFSFHLILCFAKFNYTLVICVHGFYNVVAHSWHSLNSSEGVPTYAKSFQSCHQGKGCLL